MGSAARTGTLAHHAKGGDRPAHPRAATGADGGEAAARMATAAHLG
uniref:Uncharacterized protein n=1 Tax=Streptomyces sp. NBC_00003 TaxID=2903608 RepID=A0AAU2UXC9_9ACTN